MVALTLSATTVACSGSTNSEDLTRETAKKLIAASMAAQTDGTSDKVVQVRAGEFCAGSAREATPEDPPKFVPRDVTGDIGFAHSYGLIDVSWRQIEKAAIGKESAIPACREYWKWAMTNIGNELAFHGAKSYFAWSVKVTDKGRAVGLSDTGGEAKIATRDVQAVTGLAKESEGLVDVEYRTRWRLTSEAEKAGGFDNLNIPEGFKKTIKLRKFDDGWRVVPGSSF
jgi:hypothetical protein